MEFIAKNNRFLFICDSNYLTLSGLNATSHPLSPIIQVLISCETHLTTVINDWAKILDNGGQVHTCHLKIGGQHLNILFLP